MQSAPCRGAAGKPASGKRGSGRHGRSPAAAYVTKEGDSGSRGKASENASKKIKEICSVSGNVRRKKKVGIFCH